MAGASSGRGSPIDEPRRLVNIHQNLWLADLAADDIQAAVTKLLLRQRRDCLLGSERHGGRRRTNRCGCFPEAIDLGKIQRQLVRQDTVLDLGLGPGDRFMCLRQFLHVVDAGPQRIMVELCRLHPEHVQDHVCILWIVLVPAIVQRFSCSGQRQRRYQPNLKTKAPCDRSVIIARRLNAADHRSAIRLQNFDQPIMIRTIVENLQPAPTFMAWVFDQNFIAKLGKVDGYQHRTGGYDICAGQRRSLRVGCEHSHSREP